MVLLLLLFLLNYSAFFTVQWPGAGQMHHMRYMRHL